MTINPPYRFDPLQNPVKVGGENSSGGDFVGPIYGGGIVQFTRIFQVSIGSDGPIPGRTGFLYFPRAGGLPIELSGTFGGSVDYAGSGSVSFAGQPLPLTPFPVTSVAGTTVSFGVQNGVGDLFLGPYSTDFSGLTFTQGGGRVWQCSSIDNAVWQNNGGIGDDWTYRFRLVFTRA